MPSLFANAFAVLLNAQEYATGRRRKATVAGVEVDAVVGELGFEEIIVAGGIAENGGFEIQVATASLPAGRPAQLAPVIVDGRTLKILQPVRTVNEVYIITAADPAATR